MINEKTFKIGDKVLKNLNIQGQDRKLNQIYNMDPMR